MKNKTGFEIFILDTLPRWLMYFCGLMLLVVIVVQVGMYQGRELEKENISNELRAMSNELRGSEAKLQKLEEELEHQKLIRAIAQCESSLRHEGVWGDGGKSYGWLQFQKRTFYWLAGKMVSNEQRAMNNENKLNWKDAGHQYVVADWAIKNGYGSLWTCYRRLKSAATTERREG